MGGRGTSMGGSTAWAEAVVQEVQRKQRHRQHPRPANRSCWHRSRQPGGLMQMSDQDAADTVDAIAKQSIRTDGTQNNTFIQRYLNAVGFTDDTPQLLSETAYEKARKKAGEASLYHADRNFGGKTGDHYNQQLMSGDTMYSSNGILGAGTYWAWDSASDSGEYGRYQCKGFLNSKARVVTCDQLSQLGRKFSASHPRTYAKLAKARAGYGGSDETLYSFLAATHGYNVIQNSSTKYTGCYMVTLTRSVLTMSKKTIKNATSAMQNW